MPDNDIGATFRDHVAQTFDEEWTEQTHEQSGRSWEMLQPADG